MGPEPDEPWTPVGEGGLGGGLSKGISVDDDSVEAFFELLHVLSVTDDVGNAKPGDTKGLAETKRSDCSFEKIRVQ